MEHILYSDIIRQKNENTFYRFIVATWMLCFGRCGVASGAIGFLPI